jgi:hypothetical protein
MKRNIRLFTAIVALASMLIACAPQAAATPEPGAAIPEVDIAAKDLAFDVPRQVQAGLVTINFQNQGKANHHAQLARLNDGVTLEQLQGAMKKSPNAIFGMTSMEGGPGVTAPGQGLEVMVDLVPGQYIVFDILPGEDGAPNIAKGMLAPFEVISADQPATGEALDPAVTVQMKDFLFEMPEQVSAGEQVWEIKNLGPLPHEISLVKLNDGKTTEDVTAWFQNHQGPPPFRGVGGFQGISTGKSGWIKLNLTPGTYVATCVIPEQHSGKTHLELGMVKTFTVK